MTIPFRFAFVATILWIGFVLALSFVETPIRFQIDTLAESDALSIGHRVFHALNYTEIGFAVFIIVGAIVIRPPLAANCVLVAAVVLLAVQTWMLFGILDQRTLAKIAGQELPDSPWHLAYIGLEVVKLIALATLTALQIQHFSRETNNKRTNESFDD